MDNGMSVELKLELKDKYARERDNSLGANDLRECLREIDRLQAELHSKPAYTIVGKGL